MAASSRPASSGYQKKPFKKRKLLGRDRLWIGPDHLLLVESTGVSEQYRRFFFKDIQAFNLVRHSRTSHQLSFLGFLIFCAGLGAAAAFRQDAMPLVVFLGIVCLVLGYYVVRLLIRGPACHFWIHTSVQKERLPPLDSVKKAERFLRSITPVIESIQGTVDPLAEDLSVSAAPGPAPEKGPAPGQEPVRSLPETAMSWAWHRACYALSLLVALAGAASLYMDHPVVDMLLLVTMMAGFATGVAAMVRQAGSALPAAVKWTPPLSCLLYVLMAVAGLFEMVFVWIFSKGEMENLQAISHNTWAMFRAWAAIDPFAYPVILGLNVFFIAAALCLGLAGFFLLAKEPG